MVKYKYKYTNTNTNTRIQIRTYKYKYKHRGGAPKSNFDIGPKQKDFTKTAISLEPLDLHRFNTPQIEALCMPDKKNTSGGL